MGNVGKFSMLIIDENQKDNEGWEKTIAIILSDRVRILNLNWDIRGIVFVSVKRKSGTATKNVWQNADDKSNSDYISLWPQNHDILQ